MPQEKTASDKKKFSVDWLLRGSLTRIGDIFDRFTGRSWKPTSSLATSELIDRLKLLIDREAKETGMKGVIVPHIIRLKVQWDKFSLDSEEALKKLENELLVAAIDHINDNRYHTYAPLKLEIKPDYFTEGVKLQVSFGNFVPEDSEADLNVTVPDLKNIVIPVPEGVKMEPRREIFIAEFVVKGKPKRVELELVQGRRLSVGRTGENDLAIDDGSVSKVHASLVLNKENRLMVADTGSTNGTFINEQRLAYGKAFPISQGDKLKFGLVEVSVLHAPKEMLTAGEIKDETISEMSVFFPRENSATIALEEGKVENVSNAQTVLAGGKSGLESGQSRESKLKEDNLQPTEQGIVLDFGENK